MASRSLQQHLTDRANQTEALLRNLRAQLAILRSASTLEGRRVCVEQANDNLKKEIEQLKLQLSDAEMRNGRRQFFFSTIAAVDVAQKLSNEAGALPPAATAQPSHEKECKVAAKSEKKGGPGTDSHDRGTADNAVADVAQKLANEAGALPPGATAKSGQEKESRAAAKGEKKGTEDDVLDVRRLDMRIGKIIECAAHPDADTLYVEKVDVGEASGPRTIVSGLVRHVPLEAMQGRRAVFLLNLKAAKMRGVLSQGMIMCANLDGKVEILEVPESAQPGDLVFVEGYPRQPDDQLNPKKKIFESLKPDLRVNTAGLACFREAAWQVALSDGSRQTVKSSLKDAQIS